MKNVNASSFPLELKHLLLGLLPQCEVSWLNDGCSDDEYPTFRSYVTSHPDVYEKLHSSALRIVYEKRDLLEEGKITEDEYLTWIYFCCMEPVNQGWDVEKRGFLDCKVKELPDNYRTISVEPIYF